MLADLTYSRTSCTIELRTVSLIVLGVRFLFSRTKYRRILSGFSDFPEKFKEIRYFGKNKNQQERYL